MVADTSEFVPHLCDLKPLALVARQRLPSWPASARPGYSPADSQVAKMQTELPHLGDLAATGRVESPLGGVPTSKTPRGYSAQTRQIAQMRVMRFLRYDSGVSAKRNGETMAEKCILVGQSGGPTAAINASLAGVVSAGRAAGIPVVGMRYGIQGFLAGKTVGLDEALPDEASLDLLRQTPSSWLGSCRFKLPEPSADPTFYQGLFRRFEEAGAAAVLYIGGNDSMDTIAKLGAYGRSVDSPIRFIGVPKTIDNDLVGTDHTPGYGSAARFVATAVNELARDADVYDLKSVTYVEIMGRDAGWLAASSALANPDLVLLPEIPLNEDALMERLSSLLAKKNTIMVGVSEGVRTPDGHLICEKAAPGAAVDEFGHLATLSGTSRYLAAVTKERLGCKTRAVELSTFQRCASHLASKTDLDEAFELGAAGVRAALAGESVKMCAVRRVSDEPYQAKIELVDVLAVANQVRGVPSEWISADGMGVSGEFLAYVRPLAGELPAQLASLA